MKYIRNFIHARFENHGLQAVDESEPAGFRKDTSAFGPGSFILFFTFILIVIGCDRESDYLASARKQASNSKVLYEQAVENYKKAISLKESCELHLELGKLYYQHNQFDDAINELKNLSPELSSKILAISYYKNSDYTSALNIFERNPRDLDPEYLYYFGLTCEKLNLFEKALEVYSKIEDKTYIDKAKERILAINLSEKSSKIDNPLIKQLIANAGTQENYPEAGAIILLADEAIEILPDDKAVYYKHFLVKVLNERGKKEFGEINLNYDSTYEKVELEFARTITPDGNIVVVGEKNIRDVSRYLNFPLYSNARAKIISMPEIAENSIIEYKAKITQNRMIADKEFNLNYSLQEPNPITLAKFKIIIPKEKKLFIKVINEQYNKNNFNLNPQITQQDNKIIYSWDFNGIPQIIPEIDCPPISEISPIILISSFDSWEKIYNWWEKLAYPKIKPSPEIKMKVQELIKGKKDNLEKAQAIFNYCASNIRYVAVEYGRAGYEPHEARDIFKNKYGDCKDQAILLVTMLQEIGLEAYPVLIGTKGFIDLNKDFPSVLFNHAIAAVNLGGKLYFLDPTAETSSLKDLPFTDQDRNVLVFKKDGFDILKTPLSTAGDNAIIYNMDVVIDKDGKISAKREVSASGQFALAQRYWLRYSPPEVIKQVLNQKVQEISIGARLKDYKIENLYEPDKPIKLIYAFEGGNFLISSGNLKIFPELATIDLGFIAKEKRFYPVDFGFPKKTEVKVNFKLDPSYACKYIPVSVKKELNCFSFQDSYTKTKDGVGFYQKQEFKTKKIELEEYQEFKESLETLKDKINQRIVLEKRANG